jgi:hypothetical protein
MTSAEAPCLPRATSRAIVPTMNFVQDIVIPVPRDEVCAFVSDADRLLALLGPALVVDERRVHPDGRKSLRAHVVLRSGKTVRVETEQLERTSLSGGSSIQTVKPYAPLSIGQATMRVKTTFESIPEGTLLTQQTEYRVSPLFVHLYVSLFRRDKVLLSRYRGLERLREAIVAAAR